MAGDRKVCRATCFGSTYNSPPTNSYSRPLLSLSLFRDITLPLTVRTWWRHTLGVQCLQTTRRTEVLAHRAASAPQLATGRVRRRKTREREQIRHTACSHIQGIVRGRSVVPAEGVYIGMGISCQNLSHIVRGRARQENRKGCTLLQLVNHAPTPFDLELTRKVRVSCAPLPRPTISENLTCLRATEQKWKA